MVAALRTAMAQSPDLLASTLVGTIDEETAVSAETGGVPREFLDFCRVLDGVSCNPSLELFGLEDAMGLQFYCGPVVDSLPGLSPEKLFCIGTIDQAAIFLDRAGGGVLGVPEAGADWIDAERFEQLGSSVEAFFLERLAVPAEYVRLAAIDDEFMEYDDWLKLLRRAGLGG
ncbi:MULTISPECIES: hypothetical protein [unclassified Streptomyces]|uniref:hypothetical protein n=1 Tax=unclassified Streptomyces TaxID=2593676 RepID=UPI0021AC4DF0|nr:hypothetical protein [Streptomyces sp. PsTaAH-137]